MKTTVGQNIKQLRKSFDLTQEQLSERTGLSRGQIKNWETDRHEPDLESLKVLASFLTPPQMLFLTSRTGKKMLY